MLTEELEVAVKELTSRMDTIDKAYKLAKQGVESTMVFRCAASGLYYRSDFVKEWGRKYGIGLGPTVCSESLQTDYETAPPNIDNTIKRITQIMHPVYNVKCQIDWHVAPVNETLENMAVTQEEDPDMEIRGPILLQKQLANKRNMIHVLHAAFNKSRGLTNATANH